ncbi:MAG TPA: hypothetical protein VJ599_08015, partial [Nitrososphaeraceae archaeon]|nr:hypothetical protein [Nitrososphaeraceae archaeon]
YLFGFEEKSDKNECFSISHKLFDNVINAFVSSDWEHDQNASNSLLPPSIIYPILSHLDENLI